MKGAQMTDEQLALVAKALAHPARIRIITLLSAQTECRGHEVFSELPLAQSTISEHLRILKESGLVSSTPVGTSMAYCLASGVLNEFLDSLGAIATNTSGCVADCTKGSTR
ncbi:MAG: helix-turn-helix transcriptional regulator [Actinobacteria bacterium]|nr:MAG: helix-turn-helix transcriptional regulator [Actinomycetota bacterium]